MWRIHRILRFDSVALNNILLISMPSICYLLPYHIQNPVKHLRWSVLLQPLTIFAKGSVLDVLQSSRYASGIFIFFNCCLAAPRQTLDHYREDSLTHPMLIIAFYIFGPKVTTWKHWNNKENWYKMLVFYHRNLKMF